jgi:WD40 repeat protein
MSLVRRLATVARLPRLLAAGLVLLLAHVFATNLTQSPRYVVRTEAKLDQSPFQLRGPSYWGTVEHVSDDGRQVFVGIHHGDFRGYDTRLELWDVGTGIEQTPAHWNADDWQKLLSEGANWPGTGLMGLVATGSGREFLCDEAAWAELRARLVGCRGPFPDDLRFSPDGRLVAYPTRNGCPAHWTFDYEKDGTRIDDASTGQLVATLPGVIHKVTLAPDGRTAVSRNFLEQRRGEQPWLNLWDLGAGRRRADLYFWDSSPRVAYSPDGRYVFAGGTSPGLLRWWDAETGRQVGEINQFAIPHFAGRGRVLVIQSDRVLRFWDVTTGRELSEWEPPSPRGRGGRVGELKTANGGRYLAARVGTEPDPGGGSRNPVIDWLVRRFPDGPPTTTRGRIAVLDVIDRDVPTQVPGASATFSANDRWLATLDADGVVRVWELPLGRPWGRAVLYAIAVVLGGWAFGRLVGRLRRRRADHAVPASVVEDGGP